MTVSWIKQRREIGRIVNIVRTLRKTGAPNSIIKSIISMIKADVENLKEYESYFYEY